MTEITLALNPLSQVVKICSQDILWSTLWLCKQVFEWSQISKICVEVRQTTTCFLSNPSKKDLEQLLLVACYWQDQTGQSNTKPKEVNPKTWRKNTEKHSHQVINIFTSPR